MKITKAQIIIASVSTVALGAAIFFGLTEKGKGLAKKWFGKKESASKLSKQQMQEEFDVLAAKLPRSTMSGFEKRAASLPLASLINDFTKKYGFDETSGLDFKK